MKALIFLKKLQEDKICIGDETYCFEFYKNAIQELEEFLKPKTCENCTSCKKMDNYIGYCEELDTEVNLKWGCLTFKQKEIE